MNGCALLQDLERILHTQVITVRRDPLDALPPLLVLHLLVIVASRCEYRCERQIYCNICMRFVVSEEASPNAEKNEVLRCASVAKRGDDGDHGVIDVVF